MSAECENIPEVDSPVTPTPDTRPKIVLEVRNKTGGVVMLHLTGPVYYNLEYKDGGYAWKIVPGTYEYIMYGCKGSEETGEITILQDDTWTLECTIN